MKAIWLAVAALGFAGGVAKVAELSMREYIPGWFGRRNYTLEDAAIGLLLAVLWGILFANAWRLRS